MTEFQVAKGLFDESDDRCRMSREDQRSHENVNWLSVVKRFYELFQKFWLNFWNILVERKLYLATNAIWKVWAQWGCYDKWNEKRLTWALRIFYDNFYEWHPLTLLCKFVMDECFKIFRWYDIYFIKNFISYYYKFPVRFGQQRFHSEKLHGRLQASLSDYHWVNWLSATSLIVNFTIFACSN